VKLHGNARLTPGQRRLLCQRVDEERWTVGDAADAATLWRGRRDAVRASPLHMGSLPGIGMGQNGSVRRHELS
jgi:hypothetical protein